MGSGYEYEVEKGHKESCILYLCPPDQKIKRIGDSLLPLKIMKEIYIQSRDEELEGRRIRYERSHWN